MKYTEIFKLKKMLEDSHIPFAYEEQKERQHYQICVPHLYPDRSRVISVIQGKGTFGGDCDLLEIMGLLTEKEKENDRVAGWLDAENVFARIKKYCDEHCSYKASMFEQTATIEGTVENMDDLLKIIELHRETQKKLKENGNDK